MSCHSALNRYLGLCHLFDVLTPFPLSKVGLLRFVAFLSGEGVSYPSIHVYLSVLRFLQIMSGLQDPDLSSFSRLEYVPRGTHHLSPFHHHPQRLPITLQVLCMLFEVWSQPPVLHNSMLLWPACCTGIFRFL